MRRRADFATAIVIGATVGIAFRPGISVGASPLNSQGFVNQTARMGLAEVALSQLARTRAWASGVKILAEKMLDDHAKANAELEALALARKWAVPAETDIDHRALITSLGRESGAQFDADYVSALRKDHVEAIAAFEAQATGLDGDPGLKAFAPRTPPTLKMHRDMIDKLVMQRGAIGHSRRGRE